MKPKISKTNIKYFVATVAGLLCLIFSGFGISAQYGHIQITLVWSVIFPFVVALAWGSKFGLIAGITGGALFPFLIWSNNGYANLANFVLLLLLFFLVGRIKPHHINYAFNKLIYRITILMGIFIPAAAFSYLFVFNKLVALNPPFWVSDTIYYFDQNLLIGFLVKDSINYLLLIIAAEMLLHVPVIRRALYLEPSNYFRLNQKLLIISILITGLIWSSFILLDKSLAITAYLHDFNYYLFLLFLLAATSVIVTRTIMSMLEYRLKSEENFRKKEEEFRIIFESLHAGIGIVDLEGEYRFINKWWPQKLGYTEQEMKALRNTDITHPDDIASTKEYFNKLAAKQIKEYNLKKRFITKHGETFWGQLYVSGIENSEGDIEYLAGITHDITERKKAEEKIMNIQAKQEAMIANIADVIAIIDADGINRYKSPNVEKWFGWKPHELEGRITWENVHPDDIEDGKMFFQNILSLPDNSGTFECRYRTKQGSYK